MSIFRRPSARAAASAEARAVTSLPWADTVDLDRTVNVGRDVESAMGRLVALYAAHRYIIDQFIAIPFHSYRENPDGTKRRDQNQPKILTDPHPFGALPFVWYGQLMASCLSEGNAYGLVTSTDARDQPTKIMWLDPRDCDVIDATAGPVFTWRGRRIEGRVVHIPWIVQPGKTKGLSPVGAFRSMIETGIAAQEMARDWNAGGGVPLGHLKTSAQGEVSPAKAMAGKERFKEAVRGRDLFVSGNDWDFKPFSLNPADLQFVETMKLTATQLATVYGLPPEKIGGERGGSLTYTTVVMDQLDTQVQVLGPWCVRAQQALSSLLPRPQIVRANLDAILRADPLARAQVMTAELNAGVTLLDEARAVLDRPPLTPDQRAQWLEAFRKTPTASPSQQSGGGQP